jgi:hypothetical protein
MALERTTRHLLNAATISFSGVGAFSSGVLWQRYNSGTPDFVPQGWPIHEATGLTINEAGIVGVVIALAAAALSYHASNKYTEAHFNY